jgi:hypothetical protein
VAALGWWQLQECWRQLLLHRLQLVQQETLHE